LMIPEEASFQLSAYVETPGWIRVVPRGYLVSEWAGKKWVTPLLPQMFYGATGEQLTTWRQYIPRAGWQVILYRVAGKPEIPREHLPWRQYENPSEKLVLGRRVPGVLQPIDVGLPAFATSTPGQLYEVHMETREVIVDEERLASLLLEELPRRVEGFKISWLEIDGRTVRMQVVGSPFAWSLVLALLPEIFMLVGVALLAVSIFLVWTMVPSWIAGMMFAGVLILGAGYIFRRLIAA